MTAPPDGQIKITGPEDGVARVVISNPARRNALNAAMHERLANVWPELDADPAVRAVLVTGEGDTFSAGGDVTMLRSMPADTEARIAVLEEARALVTNLLRCDTPVVSAVRGPAVGAGLAVAVLADISIVSPTALLLDGHVRIGVAAGDHAVLIWPLLCGIAKAKRHLLLPDPIPGEDAERMGLVSMCVPDDELDATATEIAARLAAGPPAALRWTKRTLNHWLRAAEPAFDASLGYEFIGFGSAEAAEGLAAFGEKRPPAW